MVLHRCGPLVSFFSFLQSIIGKPLPTLAPVFTCDFDILILNLWGINSLQPWRAQFAVFVLIILSAIE